MKLRSSLEELGAVDSSAAANAAVSLAHAVSLATRIPPALSESCQAPEIPVRCLLCMGRLSILAQATRSSLLSR